MDTLYPLKFKTIFKEKIWGGQKISSVLKKDFTPLKNCGESWEISCMPDDLSIIDNGFLAGNTLQEIIEVYMDDLVGEKVYDEFGTLFPLLIKFIDANTDLSIQVHPDDSAAMERHNSFGKTEMWYVIDAEEDAKLICGFNKDVDRDIYLEKLENKNLEEILNYESVKPGDVYFIPSGRIHSIGKGIFLTEIQQVSDITYRVYDWDRVDDNGNNRELHLDLALDAIDFKKQDNYKFDYKSKDNDAIKLISCQYFDTNFLKFDKTIKRDYAILDSFVIYICTEGEFTISYNESESIIAKFGDCILIPAILKDIILIPNKPSNIIEVFIK